MQKHILKLYVAGLSSRTESAIQNLRYIYENKLRTAYDLEIIDILEHPQLAEDEHILATPTLIRLNPAPTRRIIGDLSNIPKVMQGLGFSTSTLPSDSGKIDGDSGE
jgi:circadian clock protein KaiB